MLSRVEVHSAQPGSDSAIQSARRRWQKGTRHRGELAISRKTIAWGMPDDSGASAVNTRAHTQTTPARARLRVHLGTRHSPRPLFSKGESFRQDLGRLAPRSDFACVQWIFRRAMATRAASPEQGRNKVTVQTGRPQGAPLRRIDPVGAPPPWVSVGATLVVALPPTPSIASFSSPIQTSQ
jgi:hypothetical protein